MAYEFLFLVRDQLPGNACNDRELNYCHKYDSIREYYGTTSGLFCKINNCDFSFLSHKSCRLAFKSSPGQFYFHFHSSLSAFSTTNLSYCIYFKFTMLFFKLRCIRCLKISQLCHSRNAWGRCAKHGIPVGIFL